MKRILTVQDISCVGKCSLTVALPIISAMGVEAAVLPTAVLSTHTAFQEGFTFHDLTDEITPIADHWVKEGIGFDAIYTGYLGSFRQLELVSELFDTFGTEDNHIVIDPVMADHGKLYHGFTPEFAASALIDVLSTIAAVTTHVSKVSSCTAIRFKLNPTLNMGVIATSLISLGSGIASNAHTSPSLNT